MWTLDRVLNENKVLKVKKNKQKTPPNKQEIKTKPSEKKKKKSQTLVALKPSMP